MKGLVLRRIKRVMVLLLGCQKLDCIAHLGGLHLDDGRTLTLPLPLCFDRSKMPF